MSPRPHFIVASNGSYGDVHPFIGLAHALARRGHEVTLVCNEHYAPLAEGLSFVSGGSAAALDEAMSRFKVTAATAHMGELMHMLLVEPLEDFYAAIEGVYRPGESVLVAFPIVTAARQLHDRLGAPYAGCQLSPTVFRSAIDPARVGPFSMGWMPASVIRSIYRLLDFMIDRFVLRDVNAHRARLALPDTRRVFSWMDSPQKTVALFPEWFAAPQADWPAHSEVTDFPLFDAGDATPLPEALERFLDAGDAPVVFTAGSPAWGVGGFFAAAVEACEALGRRGVLLTRFEADVPAPLPEGVMRCAYAPFGALLPRAAALVSHGGIGTASQGLRAGIPQLIAPWGADQFDTSMRCQALGVSRELAFNKVGGGRLTRALRALLADQGARERAQAVAARFPADPSARACEALERFAAEQLGGG